MSFSREGWKSQKILAQVCRDCLSKRITPVVLHSSRRSITTAASQTAVNTSTTTSTTTKSTPSLMKSVPGLIKSTPATTNTALLKQQQELLESFRNELYQHQHPSTATTIATTISKDLYSKPRVRKAIVRRESRKKILKAYKLMKKQQPALLSQLTQQDLDKLLATLTTNPDDPYSNGPGLEALEILEDLKRGKLFRQLSFRAIDYEAMIYLASELKLTRRACNLLSEAYEKEVQLGVGAFESVLNVLAFQQKKSLQSSTQNKLEFWLQQLEEQQFEPTKKIIRAVVVSRMGVGQLESAAKHLREKGGSLYSSLMTRFEDDRELLDHALNMFAMDCLEEWRLNEVRLVYNRKRQQGMSTSLIVKHFINKCLHTGQLHTAQRMLQDTISLQDTANAQLVSRKLIEWYISQKDIKHAIGIWELASEKGVNLPQGVMEGLLVSAAKLKYHVDTMRLYHQLYPTINNNNKSIDIHVYVLRCMVRAKDFKNAIKVQQLVEKLLPNMKPNLARTTVRSLYSLAAQTGNLELFERVFKTSQQMNLSLTHKGLTSLIACYLKRKDVKSAKAAFQSVASHTDGPDVVDFNLLMRTVVMEDDNKVNYNKIFDILNHMKLVNVQPDETTMRTMLRFYKSDSDMQKALYTQLLNNPQAASRFNQVYLNNIALSSLLTRISVDHVVGIFLRNDRGELFPDQHNKRIQVNGTTYKLLFDAINKDKQYSSLSAKLLKDMDARGMKPSREIYEQIIHNWAMKGKITKARKYIHKMEQDTGEKANIKTYTKLVDGLLLLNKPSLAKNVILNDMKDMTLDHVVLQKLQFIESKLSSPSSSK